MVATCSRQGHEREQAPAQAGEQNHQAARPRRDFFSYSTRDASRHGFGEATLCHAASASDRSTEEEHVTFARLTKDITRSLAVVAASLTVGISTAHAACGEPSRQTAARVQRATIPLQDLQRQGPVYYWHDSSTYALLYFRPEDLVTSLEKFLATETGSNHDSRFGDATLAPALLDNIKVDLPLTESTDLFRYSLIDRRFDAVMNAVIADLMKEGRFMLDQWLLDESRANSIVMVSRADGEDTRWFCTATDEVLFKTGGAAD